MISHVYTGTAVATGEGMDLSSAKKTMIGIAPEAPEPSQDMRPTLPRIAPSASPTMLGIAPDATPRMPDIDATPTLPRARQARHEPPLAPRWVVPEPQLMYFAPATTTAGDVPLERAPLFALAVAAVGAVAWVLMSIALLGQW